MPVDVRVANNAFGQLASSISDTDTTITLGTGEGARFPSLTGTQYFYATLADTSNLLEIVKVTARSGDVLTVIRGQDNTTAKAYDAGDRIELRPVAALFTDLITQGRQADGILFDETIKQRLESTDVQGAIDEMVDFFSVTVKGENDNSDWTQASAADPFVATLTVNGIKATDRPIVSLDISGETLEDGIFLQRVWNLVYRVEASANDEIKLYAIDEPFPDLNLLIKVIR